MMTAIDERDALLRAVCDDPWDRDAKKIFADCLDERGECGAAMRWAADRDKCPISSAVTHNQMDGIVGLGFIGKMWIFNGMRYQSAVLPPCLFGWKKGMSAEFWDIVFRHEYQAWNAFIVAFGIAHARGKIGRKRRVK